MRQWIMVFALLGIFVGLTGKMNTAYGAVIRPKSDFVFCHIIGVNNLGDAPKEAHPLLIELMEGAKKGQKVKMRTVPLMLNGVVGLHLAPYTGFRIRPMHDKDLECFFMLYDDSAL